MNPALDSYVLGLVAASTPCFGYHERGNPTCGGCPLAERCVESRALRAVTVAAQLVKTEKAASRVAKSPAPSVGVPVPGTPASMPSSAESIDDILDSIARTPAAAQTATATPAATDFDLESLFGGLTSDAPTPAPDIVVAPTPVPPPPPTQAAPRVTVMKAVIDSVCFVCNGRVPAKSEAGFIPGKGLRHMTCA